MFSLGKYSVKWLKNSFLNKSIRVTNYSTARPTIAAEANVENNSEVIDVTALANDEKGTVHKVKDVKSNNIVAAAFASLKSEKTLVTKHPNYFDRLITKADTVDKLLGIIETNIISRQNALKVVSVLAQWSTAKKINSVDFESDPRFIKLCKILSRNSPLKVRINSQTAIRDDDLSTVLGVTGDDEAAKLIESITLPQMVKVMSILAQKKRRSTPLLRSLAYNICKNRDKLDMKQCADLMYSMSILNFPESILLERISNDVCESLESINDKSSVIGSLLTSIGFLRYKDVVLLDALTEWVLKNNNICRPQDIFALFLTFASVNHQPVNAEQLYQVLIPTMNIADVPKSSIWLDLVWSLVILQRATHQHLESVLCPDFIAKLKADNMGVSSKLKLLNVNAAAQHLVKDYTGPTLAENADVASVSITRTRDKQMMVSSVLDSLKSLLPSATYLKSNIQSKMGFVIDGECAIDKKCNPLPVNVSKDTADRIRVAILVYDYHDMCRGLAVPHGSNMLIQRLLEAQGYKLLTVSHTDFNPRDKLVQRVKYLETQLKSIASAN